MSTSLNEEPAPECRGQVLVIAFCQSESRRRVYVNK